MRNHGLPAFLLSPLSAGIGALALSWLAVRALVDLSYRDADTPIYRRYGELIESGLVPYGDFPLEYPPGAATAFTAPALVTESFSGYSLAFEGLMILCALLALVATHASMRRLNATRAQTTIGLVAIGVSPLALATVALGRYDLLPAALVALWLSLELHSRHRAAGAVLGLGIAAKLYPLALLPLAFVWALRRRGWREATLASSIAAAVCAACFLPFLILAPSGVTDSLLGQLRRPLQIESLGASLLLAGGRALGTEHSVETSSGSVNLVGTVPYLVAGVSGAAQLLLACAIWAVFARRAAPSPCDLALASAAVVTALVATGKVFSPQFLLWLVALVPLAPALTGRVAALGSVLAMLITTSWFPFRYLALTQGALAQTSLLLARNAIVLGILALLTLRLRRPADGL